MPIQKEKNITLGLLRITQIMEELGNPHLHIPPTIHVAGTNGKGSTIAFMRAILEDARYLVHCYTSPHLIRFNERIVLAGKEISDEYLKELENIVHPIAQKYSASFFETTTAIAFLAFSKVKADYLLLETGLGGRLDATNIITNPLATIITQIGFDHMEYLGDSLAKIAAEKAGIIKPDTPCITAFQDEKIIGVLKLKAADKLIISEMDNLPENISLAGEHQKINLSMAITALKYAKIKLEHENIINGAKNAKWPGRLQKISKNGKEIWLDGAHNKEGAKALAAWAKALNKPIFLVLAILSSKDIGAILDELLPIAAKIFLYDSKIGDFISSQELQSIIIQKGYNAEMIEDIAAIAYQDEILLCTGSLYFIGSLYTGLNHD